jgi:hypothetical protein
MSQVFKPVSYTNLANLGITSATSATSGVWSLTGFKTCVRLTATANCYFRIDNASTATATNGNPILQQGQDAFITLNNKVSRISTIGPDDNTNAPQIKFQNDGGNEIHHSFKVGELVKISGTSGGGHATWNAMSPTVASVVNSTCITIATSGTIAQSTGGTISLGYTISQAGVSGAGRISITEVATTG